MKLSIVIAALSEDAPILRSLPRLISTFKNRDCEIIVVASRNQSVSSIIRSQYPCIQVIETADDATIAQSRAAGISCASGDLIAVLHERYSVEPSWYVAVTESFPEYSDVLGGCVTPPPESATSLTWAMYLSEYAHIAPPLDAGPLTGPEALMTPGGNVCYRSSLFQAFSMADALWELDFHQGLIEGGKVFCRSGGMYARFMFPHTLKAYCLERWYVSKEFAALRARNARTASRLLAAVARIALPPLVVTRIAVSVCTKPQYRFHFLRCLPWISFFSLVQAAAEINGYLSPRVRTAKSRPQR